MPESPNRIVPLEQMLADAARSLREFRELRARDALCVEGNELLSSTAAESFLAAFNLHGEYLTDAITLLTEISTLDDPCLAEPGQRATFPRLIEQLSDSFDPEYGLLYDRAFAQMIDITRRLPKAAALNAALLRFETGDARSLLLRKARLRDPGKHLPTSARGGVLKVLVLSRVTMGADVAITSVVLHKAASIFHNAERILIGPAKTVELFGGDPTLRFLPISYKSNGGLIDRLLNWLAILEGVESEIAGLIEDQYVIIDPDSRLLQLGMLPVVKGDARYFFFESRRWEDTFDDPMGVNTAKWLGQTFGDEIAILPAVWLREADRRLGSDLVQRMRDSDGSSSTSRRQIAAISFGNGGNSAKRAPDPFESSLLLRLLSSGVSVVLDKGYGEEEAQRAERLIDAAREKGYPVTVASETSAADITPEGARGKAWMLVWQGGIGTWAGLIAASDEFIGYDSAGQHLAAALRVPLTDIFIEPSTAKFRSRWRPSGRGLIRIIDRASQPVDPHQLVDDVMRARATPDTKSE